MQEQSSGSKVLFALLALILLTGAAWRIWLAVTSLPMSSEEFGTWRDVTRSNLGQMITWDHHRTHPPLNYLLVKLSILLTGREDMWVLRLPTLLFSILSIPLGYLLGRSLHGKTMGVSLAGIMAFWSFLLHQAHYARMYSATVAFGLLALWMLARSCAPLPSRASGLRWMPSVALGASLAALFWTSSAGLFLVAGIPLGLVGGWVLVRLAKLPSNEQPARANQFAGLAVTVGTWFLMSLPGLLHYLHESRQRAGRVVFIGGEPVEGGPDRYIGGLLSHPIESTLCLVGLGFIAARWKSHPRWVCATLAIAAINLVSVAAVGHTRDRYLVCFFLCGLVGLAWFSAWMADAVQRTNGRFSNLDRLTRRGVALGIVLLPGLAFLGIEIVRGYPCSTMYATSAMAVRDAVPEGALVVAHPAYRMASLRYYGVNAISLPQARRKLPPAGVWFFAGDSRSQAQKKELEAALTSLLSCYGHELDEHLLNQCFRAERVPIVEITPQTVRVIFASGENSGESEG